LCALGAEFLNSYVNFRLQIVKAVNTSVIWYLLYRNRGLKSQKLAAVGFLILGGASNGITVKKNI
jgi:hypothetical protein